MLEKILGFLHDAEPPARHRTTAGFDHEKLTLLFSHFPIGRRLRYYPEYLREATLETLVIGYSVNGQFVYANDKIMFNPDSGLTGFQVAGNKALPAANLDKVFILVPDTSEQERRLDYLTRAELGHSGQFGRGKSITLVAQSGSHCITTLDTTVSRRQVLKDGPYINDAIVLLDPDLSSLAVADKRKELRVPAAVGAKLRYGKDSAYLCNCMLHDFSESSLRLQSASPEQAMPALRSNETVVVEFALAEKESPYRFRGKVLRSDGTTCVIHTEQRYVDSNFRSISLMDVLEVKARLLNNEP